MLNPSSRFNKVSGTVKGNRKKRDLKQVKTKTERRRGKGSETKLFYKQNNYLFYKLTRHEDMTRKRRATTINIRYADKQCDNSKRTNNRQTTTTTNETIKQKVTKPTPITQISTTLRQSPYQWKEGYWC